MQFLYPEFLFALSALLIPIAIHLFNFRKFKRVYFTNVKFLREIKQETQSKSQLKHLLILLCRLLAIFFLVMAFAQPFIPLTQKSKNQNNKSVSLYIDNSFSMDALSEMGSLLELAKVKAKEIVQSNNTNTNFHILTNDFEGKNQRWLSKDEAIEVIKEIKSSANVKQLPVVIKRQMDMLESIQDKSCTSYLISDFQKNNFAFNNLQNDSNVHFVIVPLVTKSQNNLFIDTCWFDTPLHLITKSQTLYVSIQNKSLTDVENVPLKLFINKQQKALSSISLNAGSKGVFKLSFTNNSKGIQKAELQLTDYPVVFDDKLYFSFNITPKIKVLSIESDNPNHSIDALFKNDSAFSFHSFSEKNIDYSALPTMNLIFLNELNQISSGLAQELNRFVKKGGHLFIFPSLKIESNSYKNFLSDMGAPFFGALDSGITKVESINMQHPLFENVFDSKKKNKNITDLPSVHQHYTFVSGLKSTFESLMKLENSGIFLGERKFGEGSVYLCSVGLNATFSNFGKHALFVPTLYQSALQSVYASNYYFIIGNPAPIDIGKNNLGSEEVCHLKNLDENFDIIPQHMANESGNTIVLDDQIKAAGNYLLTAKNDTLSILAFNYNRKESDLNCFSIEEIEKQIDVYAYSNFSIVSGNNKEFSAALNQLSLGKRYWKICILLTLFFMAAEIALIRWMK